MQLRVQRQYPPLLTIRQPLLRHRYLRLQQSLLAELGGQVFQTNQDNSLRSIVMKDVAWLEETVVSSIFLIRHPVLKG